MPRYRVYCYRRRPSGQWTQDERCRTVEARDERQALDQANRELFGTYWHATYATPADDEPEEDAD